jgi:MFS family permease
MLLLPAFGGVVADRVQRLALLRVTNVLWIVIMGVLATLTWLGTVTYWQIIAVSFLSSCTLAFDNPTRQALIPDLVPRSELLSAISLNSVAFTGASLVGPALAGAIITAFGQDVYRGTAVVFYLNTLSYLAVLVPVLFWIRAPERERTGPSASMGQDLKEGLSYVKQRQPLVLLLVLTAVTNVFGRSFSQLMPVFSKDVLHVGADGLGLMYSAPGAGTLAAGTALASLAHGGGRRHLISGATVAFTVAIFAFALSRSFLLSLALLFVTGLTSTAAQATISTLLQSKVPGRLRGRVMSLQTLAIIGMGPLGGLFSGALATVVPAPVAVSASAAVILVVLAAIVATQPAWRDVDVDRGDD